MAENKVVYANQDVTLHKSQGKFDTAFGTTQEVVEAVVLSAGETFPYDQLTEYQKEAADNGTLAGVEVLSEEEAQKKAEFVAAARAAVAGPTTSFTTQTLTGGPEANDGSFSDHLVSDAERVANHAARAEEEAGEAVPEDAEPTVAGADRDNSPATAGRKTRKLDKDEVQGTGGADAADEKKDK